MDPAVKPRDDKFKKSKAEGCAMARAVQTGTQASRANFQRGYRAAQQADASQTQSPGTVITAIESFLFPGRREHRESKAEGCAMARAVQTGTQASRANFQRGYRAAQQADASQTQS
ncbi:MAG: hypothetical protein GY802_14645, partial [Gammaproteobacteria bacterium]|nr:hypothetical protein [Gammaproteobacteria bacterium]